MDDRGTSAGTSDLATQWLPYTWSAGLLLFAIAGFVALVASLQSAEEAQVHAHAEEEAARLAKVVSVFRTLYTSEVVDRVKGTDIEVRSDYRSVPHAIPLPATLSMRLGARLGAEGGGARTQLYSPFPFTGRDRIPLPDSFAAQAWAFLSEHPEGNFSRIEVLDHGETLRFAVADRMRRQCVGCHNTHPDSPKRDWVVGDVRGVLEVTVPLGSAQQRAGQALGWATGLLAGYVAIGIAGVATLVYVARRHQRQLLGHVTEVMRAHERQQKIARVLKTTNEELESVVYAASHDLRSPLVNVQGFAQELQLSLGELREAIAEATLDDPTRERTRHILDVEVPESLKFIQGSANSIERMLSALLRLSRLGRVMLRPSQLDMNKIVAQLHKDVSYRLGELDGTLEIGKLPSCWGDDDQIAQAFSNLIDNAIKYAHPKRAPEIVVTGDTQDDVVVYRVSDNGIGIAIEHQEKVFQLFHRLVPRGAALGEGLGLTTARRVVDRSSGTISIESSLGVGSTFIVTLPRRAPQDDDA